MTPIKELLADSRRILKLYGLGALLFFIGLGTIVGADQLFSPSLKQEAYALIGVLLGGSGFCIAMFAQLLLIIQRFSQMGSRPHGERNSRRRNRRF